MGVWAHNKGHQHLRTTNCSQVLEVVIRLFLGRFAADLRHRLLAPTIVASFVDSLAVGPAVQVTIFLQLEVDGAFIGVSC